MQTRQQQVHTEVCKEHHAESDRTEPGCWQATVFEPHESDVDHNQVEPPQVVPESNDPTTSTMLGCGFGCLCMVAAYLVFGIAVVLVAPLLFEGDLEKIAETGSAIGMFAVAPAAGILGFLLFRRRKRS